MVKKLLVILLFSHAANAFAQSAEPMLSSMDMDSLCKAYFASCPPVKGTYIKKEHELFDIEYPADWEEGIPMKQGLTISSNTFADKQKRSFTLSVLPPVIDDMKPNPLVGYNLYVEGMYGTNEMVLLIRNDLMPQNDGTVNWRLEIKLRPFKKDAYTYWLIMSKRHDKHERPNWCEFGRIIQSLKIKE